MWWGCQEDTVVTKQTATWGSEHFLPPDQALPEDSSGCSLQGTRTPFPFSLSLLLSGQENSRALGVGAITGIVIAVLLVLTPLAGLGCFIFLHRYSGIPRCCSCPRLTLVLEEGHPLLQFPAWISRTFPLPHGYSLLSFSSCLTWY